MFQKSVANCVTDTRILVLKLHLPIPANYPMLKKAWPLKLVARFGNLDAMYFYIGLTPLPFMEGEFLQQWLEREEVQLEGINLTNEVVDRLIEFRNSRVTMIITVTNQLGVIE